MFVFIVAVSNLLQATAHGAEGTEEEPEPVWRVLFSSCHDLIVNVIPLSTIKTVVVVWQIITQVGSLSKDIKHLIVSDTQLASCVWASLFRPVFWEGTVKAKTTARRGPASHTDSATTICPWRSIPATVFKIIEGVYA